MTGRVFGVALAMMLVCGQCHAQGTETEKTGVQTGGRAAVAMQTFRYKYIEDGHQSVEMDRVLRAVLSKDTDIVPDDFQNAVLVRGTAEQLALAQKVIGEMDRPAGTVLPMQIFYLHNSPQPNDGNEIYTAIRNLLPPEIKVFYIPSSSAILLRAPQEQLATAQRLIQQLDLPKKTFRLTYTITEMDGGKRVGDPQRYAFVVASGQRTTAKRNSKVPIATGSSSSNTPGVVVQTQFTYVDVGMTFDATLTETGSGAMLKTKVDLSSVAPPDNAVDLHQAVVRNTTIEGAAMLVLGKPLMLGSLDVPGSTAAHSDVEVLLEEVK